MSYLHAHRLSGCDPTIMRPVLMHSLTPLEELSPDPCTEPPSLLSRTSETHLSQSELVQHTPRTSSPPEPRADAFTNKGLKKDVQNFVTSPSSCTVSALNNNSLPLVAAKHQYQPDSANTFQGQPQDLGNALRNFPTATSACWKKVQTVIFTANTLPNSLSNNSSYIRLSCSNEYTRPRIYCSPTATRANYQRQPCFQNIRPNDIVFGDVIGKGGFGKVYTGHIKGQSVAIKVVQKRRGSGIHREILQAERLAFSLNLRHDNIVNILAVNLCDGLRGDALIVMELVSPQTLQFILDDNTRVITQSHRLTFALQITKALNYLHDNDVVHLDVKPRNVLMTAENTCKLADFGSLTRTRPDVPREETEFTQLLGTLPYRAPELMKGCFPSSKADIYSLGMTFWQLATRQTPHIGANPHWLIYQVTKENRRPDHHDTGNDTTEIKYRDLYTACWDTEPTLRPSACDIIVSLNTFLHYLWGDGCKER